MKQKANRFIDFFKTILIYLLTASMLTTAGLYINERQNAGQTEEIPPEKRRIFEIGGMALAEINEEHITPVQITVTVRGNSFTAIHSDKSIFDIYEHNIKYSVRDIFGKNTVCTPLDEASGGELWAECVNFPQSVYIKYAGNYIYPIIYAFLEKGWELRNSAEDFLGELAMVHELFIIGDDPVYGVARDSYGNVSLFVPDQKTNSQLKIRMESDSLSAYNNIAGTIPCEFLKNREISEQTGINQNSIENMKFPENFHLFSNYSKYSFVLEFSNPLLDDEGKINTEQTYIKNLFKNLNFNIENSAFYPEYDGMTFRDQKNTIKFFYNGQISYSYKPSDPSESGGGLHLAKFLSYDDKYYTYYEKIKAASVFVSSLDKELTGNESKIYLKDTKVDSSGNTTVTFSYYYEGIEIKLGGSNECIIITINENSFTEVKINSLYIDLSPLGMAKNRNPIFDLGAIDREISKQLGDESKTPQEIALRYRLKYDEALNKFVANEFNLVYNITYQSGENNTVTAIWELQ